MRNQSINITDVMHSLITQIVSSGKTTQDLMTATGIDVSKMDDPNFMVSFQNYIDLWEYAVEITGDPALALRPVDAIDPRDQGFIVRIAKCSADLREAFQHWIQYNWSLTRARQIYWQEEDHSVKIAFNPGDISYRSVHIAEHTMAAFVAHARIMTETDIRPDKVSFFHSKPDYSAEYEKVFKCTVRFNHSENSLYIPKEVLSLPIKSHDPFLVSLLKQFADKEQGQKKKAETTRDKVIKYIVTNIPKHRPQVEAAAEFLNISRSTLLRRLKDEGTTFKELFDFTRKELALSYLKQNLTISEIAYLLGFSEPSAFQHTFKRWFGVNPGAKKKSISG